ncbi:glutamine synthetase [Capronia coronata CBS 617.96]|uniref:Glutamine synthetase n=1 Tax=Capronia coronata CBS 617.96 TaxID=1182541 RepID=W9Y6G9_9EURO|nr:glutamine synthetase [Capronia coronata CBS 617.96]EXJ88128.1 glutamine synthetase [Capronia coronata CBS 617.96]
MGSTSDDVPTKDNIAALLANDQMVKVGCIDSDGVLRGKIMSTEKFLSSIDQGFGMSSVLFGWDIQDTLYTTETTICPAAEGYGDFAAIPDLSSFRRLPWEDNIPLFLFRLMSKNGPVAADGRGILKSLCNKIGTRGLKSLAGIELEFMNFQTPTEDGYSSSGYRNLAAYLSNNAPGSLRTLTQGSFCYSLTRPMANKQYFHQIFNDSLRFKTDLEGWHTESGPGVFEAALKVQEIDELADRATLFKLLVKSIGVERNITPCFMAKPVHGLPGNSGHIHISLVDKDGKNAFARKEPDTNAQWKDIENVSDIGRQFLAGLLLALPDLMPLLAPTINSYKRLVENYWAPVNVSWGLEDRSASIRLIAPPVSKPGATRFEIRIPGADLNPHYALAAILGAGWRGIEQQLEIPVPPCSARLDKPELLPNSLDAAVARFRAPRSLSREIFSDEFVDFFAASREHEIRLYKEAVTDWEFKRYIELV